MITSSDGISMEYKIVGAPGWPDPYVTNDGDKAARFHAEHGGKVYFRPVSEWLPIDGVVTDPRELGGDISGPGGPFDFGQVVIDASRAILVDFQEWAKLDEGARDQEAFVALYEGRINQTQDRAKVMLMGSLDFMAAAITEMHGVAERAGVNERLIEACQARWQEMPHPE